MFIVAQCSNRSPFVWLFVERLEVIGELLKSEKFELQFVRLDCTNCLLLTVLASHRCPVSSNRCRAVIFAAALRPGLQPPAGALPAGSPVPAALPQHSEETHTHTHMYFRHTNSVLRLVLAQPAGQPAVLPENPPQLHRPTPLTKGC